VVTKTDQGPRVRLEGCPRCRRPLVLDHAGRTGLDGMPEADPVRVLLVQRLHLASCPG
jgi:hypothetical protein